MANWLLFLLTRLSLCGFQHGSVPRSGVCGVYGNMCEKTVLFLYSVYDVSNSQLVPHVLLKRRVAGASTLSVAFPPIYIPLH